MKKIMIIGSTGSGKTTLCQRINGITEQYKKTQTLEVINYTIDTPGEYLDRKNYFHALLVTSVEVDAVLMVQDATSNQFKYSPGLSSAFSIPCIGVVTKIDIASYGRIRNSIKLLRLAGVSKVICLSSKTGRNFEGLINYLRK